jgi:hypothetical protein
MKRVVGERASIRLIWNHVIRPNSMPISCYISTPTIPCLILTALYSRFSLGTNQGIIQDTHLVPTAQTVTTQNRVAPGTKNLPLIALLGVKLWPCRLIGALSFVLISPRSALVSYLCSWRG